MELSDPRFQDIQPEKINSYELVYEQGINPNLRSSVSGYYNRMDDLINFQNGSFTNFNADTLGLELALEGKWENEIRTRLSYTLQHTENRDGGGGLPDSPLHLIKFNASAPLLRDKLFAGLEVQFTSKRHTVYPRAGAHAESARTEGGFSGLSFMGIGVVVVDHCAGKR